MNDSEYQDLIVGAVVVFEMPPDQIKMTVAGFKDEKVKVMWFDREHELHESDIDYRLLRVI